MRKTTKQKPIVMPIAVRQRAQTAHLVNFESNIKVTLNIAIRTANVIKPIIYSLSSVDRPTNASNAAIIPDHIFFRSSIISPNNYCLL